MPRWCFTGVRTQSTGKGGPWKSISIMHYCMAHCSQIQCTCSTGATLWSTTLWCQVSRGNRSVCPHLLSAVHWRAIKAGCLYVNVTQRVSLGWKKTYRFCIRVQVLSEVGILEKRMQNTTGISFNRKPWEGNYLMYDKSWFSYSPCFSNVQ